MTVLYEVKTGHTKEVLKAFTKVFLKMESWKTVFKLGAVAAVFLMIPRAFTVPLLCEMMCWFIGGFIVIFTLARPYLIYVNLANQDKYYLKHMEITMSFGNSAFTVVDDETRDFKYHLIKSMFFDDKMLYLEMEDRDLFIIPRGDFVQGVAEEFISYMERVTEKKFSDINERFRRRLPTRAAVSKS